MKENSFDFNDFIEQLDQVMGMGPIEDLLKMIPGMSNMPVLKMSKSIQKMWHGNGRWSYQ